MMMEMASLIQKIMAMMETEFLMTLMTGLPSESPTFSIVSFQTGKTQDY